MGIGQFKEVLSELEVTRRGFIIPVRNGLFAGKYQKSIKKRIIGIQKRVYFLWEGKLPGVFNIALEKPETPIC
jgi:hypothetical protein